MRILLVRHGQSEADLLDVHEGRADYPLTDLGNTQAERLARWMKNNYRLEAIWSSPLRRAAQTAEHIARYAQVDVRYKADLMEFNNGKLAGMSRQEAAIKYPIPSSPRKPHEKIPGGESEIEFRARVETVVSEILCESERLNCIAIVSHGGTVSRILQSVLRLPLDCDVQFNTGDTGVHLLEKINSDVIVRFMNRASHLEG